MTAETAPGVISDETRRLHVVGPEDFDSQPRHYLDVAPGERVVFGDHELRAIPYDKLFVFPQVRPGLSPIRDQLTDDIEAQNLGSMLDVARLDQVGLKEYAAFVSKAWKTNIDISEYVDKQDADGYYFLVIAGHTRYSSIGDVIKKRGIDNADVMVKIHRDLTPYEIVQKQLGENIHKEPPKERQAIALVEAYFFGIEAGEWANRTEFIKAQGGKISRKTLNAALNFANLPDKLRDLVFEGKLPYAGAIEIGRCEPIIREFVQTVYFEDDDAALDDASDELQTLIHIKMQNMVTSIQNKKLNGPAAVKHVQGHISDYEGQIARKKNEETPLQLIMVSPAVQLRALINEELKILKNGLKELAREPVAQRIELLTIHARFGKDYLPHDILDGLHEDLESYLRQVGSSALKSELSRD